jgi:hypothetical protein
MKKDIDFISLTVTDTGMVANDLTEEEELYYVKKHIWILGYIKNPSEELEMEVVRNYDYKNNRFRSVIYDLQSEKAIELYKKLKKAHRIIK